MQNRRPPEDRRYGHHPAPRTPHVYAKHVVHGKDEDVVTVTHTIGGAIRSDTYTRKKKHVDPKWRKAGNAASLIFIIACIALMIAFAVYVLVIMPKK